MTTDPACANLHFSKQPRPVRVEISYNTDTNGEPIWYDISKQVLSITNVDINGEPIILSAPHPDDQHRHREEQS